MNGINTPLGWKMKLGQQFSELKRAEMGLSSKYDSNIKTKTPGLNCKITLLPKDTKGTLNLANRKPNKKDDDGKNYFKHFSDVNINSNDAFLEASMYRYNGDLSTAWIDRFNYEEKVFHETLTNNFSSYSKLFNITDKKNKNKINDKAVGIEWFGYFITPSLGEYTISINVGSGYCLVWIGSKAICEYTIANSDISSQSGSFTTKVLEDRYYPIRLQYYCNADDSNYNRNFEFTITREDTQLQIDLTKCLFSLKTVNNKPYYPKLVYCAFVSTSLDNFTYGNFDCYTVDISNNNIDEFKQFYNVMNIEKYNHIIKKNDQDKVSGIMQYGTLKDGNNYTDVSDSLNTNSKPVIFSIYRLDSDIRMNKVFQVKTKREHSTDPYNLSIMDIPFNEGRSYEAFPYFYPGNIDSSKRMDADGCRQKCDDSPGCGHYYTYKTNKMPMCIIGVDKKTPGYSQMRPIGRTADESIDENTSTLYVRSLNFPKVSGCGSRSILLNSDEDVIANVDYSNTFKYSNYALSSRSIKSHNKVGNCSTAEFLKLEEEARNILYSKTLYQKSGKYKRPDETMDFANYPSSTDKSYWSSIKLQEGMRGIKEGLDVKNTNAIKDTEDKISEISIKDAQFAGNQFAINNNLYNLSNNLIPVYLDQRDEMNKNLNSDLNEKSLLYFRDKRIPTLKEQTAFDANESGFMQNSLYVLGTMTAISLLILAVLIARE
jgi:hypothetical protein